MIDETTERSTRHAVKHLTSYRESSSSKGWDTAEPKLISSAVVFSMARKGNTHSDHFTVPVPEPNFMIADNMAKARLLEAQSPVVEAVTPSDMTPGVGAIGIG